MTSERQTEFADFDIPKLDFSLSATDGQRSAIPAERERCYINAGARQWSELLAGLYIPKLYGLITSLSGLTTCPWLKLKRRNQQQTECQLENFSHTLLVSNFHLR